MGIKLPPTIVGEVLQICDGDKRGGWSSENNDAIIL